MLLKKLKVDDVVDAFPVHGVCGIWGVLALGLFGNPDEGVGGNGLFYGGDQLRTQVMAVLVIIAWTAALSAVIFAPLLKVGMLRLGDDFQNTGADLMEHTPPKAFLTLDKDVEGQNAPLSEQTGPVPAPEPVKKLWPEAAPAEAACECVKVEAAV